MAHPSFIVLGAVKAGTTSLYNYLGQHPAIQMSSWNWPRYFHVADGPPDFAALAALHGTELRAESEGRFAMMCPPQIPRSMMQYETLWPDTDTTSVRGEVSPTYLHDPEVCARISERIPEARLLVVLRDPIDRAYSHFVMDRRRGWEDIHDFDDALAREPVGTDSFWWGRRHYIRHGLYADNVQRYLESFSRDQIQIMFFDDLVRDSGSFVRKILEFVGVDPDVAIDTSIQHHKGSVKGDTRLSRLLYANFPGRRLIGRSLSGTVRTMISKKIEHITHQVPAPIRPGVREKLAGIFREDVLRLQSMVDRDLSSWLS